MVSQSRRHVPKSTKATDFNVVAVILLVCSSIFALIAHRVGWMDIHLNLQSPDVFSFTAPILDGDVEGELAYINQQFQTRCSLLKSVEGKYRNCGISIGLGPEIYDGAHDISQGVNLARYDRIELKVTHQSPNKSDRIRVSFRHFDPLLSNKDEFVSLKFNSVVYTPNKDPEPLNIPLKAFKVDDWWLKQFNVSFDNAQLDFSNIVFLEIVSDDMQSKGEYFYRIDSAVLYGEFLSELELLQVIFFVSLLTTLLLVFRQSKILDKVAKTDILTRTLNRRGIEELINKKIANREHTKAFLFYFDIDGFKLVNDTHGHQIGDVLLLEIARLIDQIFNDDQFRIGDLFLSRLGGDEFCVYVENVDKKQSKQLAQLMIDSLSLPMEIEKRLIKIGVSVGIVKLLEEHKRFSLALEQADTAMYVAKKEGKNCFRVFDDKVKTVIFESKRIASALKSALDQEEMYLVLMPIVDSKTKKIKKAEVLLRTHSKALQAVGPEVFIPIAEEFGIIQRIDMWVIEKTFAFIKLNLALIQAHNVVVAINISSKEMNNIHFYSLFKGLLQQYQIPPKYIELEITETCFALVDTASVMALSKLRGLGIALALDDFGTGYSAFQHIEEYPIDSLKIDKSFIDRYQSNKDSDRAIITAIIAIAHSHKLNVVAEGVETQEQSDYLSEQGCDLLQGYFYSKPILPDEFLEMFDEM
jgi:diguanylate cyclase (GGDEF)-like protein